MPACPYCGEQLHYDDYFGRIAAHQDSKVVGDIYKCANEECEAYQQSFYTYRHNSGELREGYPV